MQVKLLIADDASESETSIRPLFKEKQISVAGIAVLPDVSLKGEGAPAGVPVFQH